jgi:hypothetical protein
MLTAFFLTDKFNGKIVNRSNYGATPSQDGNYDTNVSDPRPRVRWITGADTVAESRSYGLFTVDDSNKYIQISGSPLPAVATTYTVPIGLYSADQLAATITSLLQASGPYTSWSCDYTSQGRFRFAGTGTVLFRWKTGTHGSDGTGTSLAKEMGFDDSADQLAGGAYPVATAAELRFDTTTMILFDKGDSTADLYAWLCDIDTSGGVDDAVDGSSVKIYGSGTQLAFDVQSWASGAATTLTFSAAPQYEENSIRLAHNGGSAASHRYWCWIWRHQDEVQRHKVGLCKAFNRTWSGTRTVSTMAGHGMQQPQRGLGINNYYPVTQLRRWNVPLTFDSWGATDYQTVVQGVVRHGKADGLLWALRWDDIASGAVNAKGEADKGFLVWGALQEYSLDTFVGESADYMSGSLRIEQLR